MTKKAREQLRKSRAAEQAENYQINKYLKQLEKSLANKGIEVNNLQEELKKAKEELKRTTRELRKERSSHQETKRQLESVHATIEKSLKKLGVKIPTGMSGVKALENVAATSGPFDSYGYTKGWEYSAQKAGNRLEKAHPGFFQAMKMVEANGGNVLDLLINYYGVKWHKSEIYADDSSATIDEDYQLLGRVCYEQYNVIIPGYEG